MRYFTITSVMLWLSGCGHPATVEECEAIVARIARLEIRERNKNIDESELRAQVEETKESLHQKTLKRCVGRRITDSALNCVESATSSQQIIDDCLD